MSGKKQVRRLSSAPSRELFVGLDVHKKSVVATVLDREGNRVDQSSFGSRDSELITYLNSLSGRKHACRSLQRETRERERERARRSPR